MKTKLGLITQFNENYFYSWHYLMMRKELYFLKLCPIFVGSLDKFAMRYENLYFDLNARSKIQILNDNNHVSSKQSTKIFLY